MWLQKMTIEILKFRRKTNFGKVFLQTCVSNTKNALYVFVLNVKQQK